jgi:catechol 2,3-dioxygenase-like lactoylglutathione lyase family enzyme
MTVHGVHHVTLTVRDVATAEAAYRDVFGLDVLFREGTYDDEFGALPDGMNWDVAETAGVDPGMTFLGDDDVAIAVAEREGDDSDTDEAGVLDHVALHVDADVVDEIVERARERDWDVDERETVAFLVDDDGIEWEVTTSDPPPATPFDELDVDP